MTHKVTKGDRITRPMYAQDEFVQHAGQVAQVLERWLSSRGWRYTTEAPDGAHHMATEDELTPAPLCSWCDEPATGRACGDLACDHHQRVYSDEQHLEQFAVMFAE